MKDKAQYMIIRHLFSLDTLYIISHYRKLIIEKAWILYAVRRYTQLTLEYAEDHGSSTRRKFVVNFCQMFCVFFFDKIHLIGCRNNSLLSIFKVLT